MNAEQIAVFEQNARVVNSEHMAFGQKLHLRALRKGLAEQEIAIAMLKIHRAGQGGQFLRHGEGKIISNIIAQPGIKQIAENIDAIGLLRGNMRESTTKSGVDAGLRRAEMTIGEEIVAGHYFS